MDGFRQNQRKSEAVDTPFKDFALPSRDRVMALLPNPPADLEGSDLFITPLVNGRNNRVFRVTVRDVDYLLKAYFQHPGDTRDRLGAEFAFTSFSWHQGLKTPPRPISRDDQYSLGLYEFIPGRSLRPGEVTIEHVQAAMEFALALNRNKHDQAAQKLSPASESCFSINEHLGCVDRRFEKLTAIEPTDKVSREATVFIKENFVPFWAEAKEWVRDQAACLDLDPKDLLSWEQRYLSPSDFGFHNALVESDGTVRFIDFEYAGWDDPAKMICDFFCQPEVPVPFEYFDFFLNTITEQSSNPDLLRKRTKLLLPACRLKWCCIMLNDFLPVDNERRKYASNNNDRRKLQLNKARRYFSKYILATDTH